MMGSICLSSFLLHSYSTFHPSPFSNYCGFGVEGGCFIRLKASSYSTFIHKRVFEWFAKNEKVLMFFTKTKFHPSLLTEEEKGFESISFSTVKKNVLQLLHKL
jgi:hypothetical protein